MRLVLGLLELTVAILLLGAFVSQVIIPGMNGRPLFPWLRQDNRLAEKNRAEALEQLDLAETAEETAKIERLVEAVQGIHHELAAARADRDTAVLERDAAKIRRSAERMRSIEEQLTVAEEDLAAARQEEVLAAKKREAQKARAGN